MRICSVPYYNTLPLTWFLSEFLSDVELSTDYPANLADRLREREIELAMMPIGSLPGFENGNIVSNVCIGSHGSVSSVLLFSRKPLETIASIALDNDSRTSVTLGQIILREFYGNYDYKTEQLSRTTSLDELSTDAFLMIGDRALACLPNKRLWPFRFDLGELWLQYTGFPFVFATWVTNDSRMAGDQNIIVALEKARDMGVANFETIVRNIVKQNEAGEMIFSQQVSGERLLDYYRLNMVYTTTEKHCQGMELYFELGRKYRLFP